MSKETFRTALVPNEYRVKNNGNCRHKWWWWRLVTELRHCFAMIFFPSKEQTTFIDIWVLLEFGLNESWIKLFSIGPTMDLGRPLGFWRNGNLFMENKEGHLVLWDPFTGKFKNLKIDKPNRFLEVFQYKPSRRGDYINGASMHVLWQRNGYKIIRRYCIL
ncbi:f-box protein [Quercus suber]|uniref:F-box protein n=1 Tax=Quercus suber TaxID=58331 RepID=A0AAW0KIF0_QUESU